MDREMRRLQEAVGAALLVAAATLSCGRSPIGPDPDPTPDTLYEKAGLQRVSISGFGLSNDPEFPVCTPFGVPMAGTQIITTMLLAKEGADWVARSVSPEDGDAVIRFRGTGGGLIGKPTLAGTATGFQRYTGFGPRPPDVVRLIIDGTAVIDGVSDFGLFTYGKMTGSFRFVDDKGNTGNCTVVAWDLQPAQK